MRRLWLAVYFAACVSFGVLSFPPIASAYPAEVSITGFVKNTIGGGGNYIRTSDPRFIRATSGAIQVATEARIVGVVRSVPAVVELAPTAGRVIAGACFANPLVCAGAVGIAAWYAESRMYPKPDGSGEYEQEYDEEADGYRTAIGGSNRYSLTRSGLAEIAMGYLCGPPPGLGYYHCEWSIRDGHEARWAGSTLSADFTVRYHLSSSGTTWYSSSYTTNPYHGEFPKRRPATEADHTNHGTTKPPTADAANDASERWPVPVNSPTFTPTRSPTGDPYKRPDGSTVQDVHDVYGKPETTEPMDVDVRPGTVPVEEADDDISGGTGGGSGTPTERPEDPCLTNPDRAGCKPLGTVAPSVLPSQNIPTPLEPTGGWTGDSSCPAPISVSTGAAGVITFDWALFCEAATYARPVVIGVAWMISLFTFFGMARRSD